MRPTLRSHLSIAIAGIVLSSLPAWAQEPPIPTPAPRDSGVVTRAITWASDKFSNGGGDGFFPELGHMVPGAGLAGGPRYRRHLFDGRAVVNTAAAVSWRRYSMVRTSIEWPAAFGGLVAFAGGANYQDAARVNYFGIGARTTSDAHTDYRIRSLDVTGSARLRLSDSVKVTTGGGMLTRPAIDRGRSDIVPSIERRFDEGTAPGLTAAPRYLHADISVERDSRDAPGYPTRGGLYRLSAVAFHDADGSGQSFRQVDADAARYLALYRDKAGIAVHGRMTLSQTGAGNAVPFYLLPTLGGGDTLRGYADYRFRDRNAALLNVEYRWRVFTLMDAAVFTDIGTVAESPGELLARHRSRDYGFGVRLHSKTRTIGRVDIARSDEGTRLLLALAAPFGSVRRSPSVPYVP